LHDVHAAGQVGASPCASPLGASIVPGEMQNPSTHIRPVLHCDVSVHANSPLRCVTEQLPPNAKTRAIAKTASAATSVALIAYLRW
jgi:hypothetical protein